MASLRLSRWTQLLLLILITILLITSVDAKKKKKKKKSTETEDVVAATPTTTTSDDTSDIDIEAVLAAKKQKKQVKDEEDVPAAAATPAAETATSEEDVVSIRARRAKAATALAKRREKRAKAAAARLAKAQQNNQQAARRRAAREEQLESYHARQQSKLDKANKAKIAADHPDNRKRAQEKLNWMNKEAGRSSQRIISMDVDTFKTYVNDGPRPYWVFAAFTSLMQTKPVCHQCHDAYSQYVPLAIAHHEHRRNMPTATVPALYFDLNNTHAQADEHKMPVFFVQLEASRSGKLFDILKLNGVPAIMLVPPRPATSTPDLRTFLTSLPPRYRYQLNQPRFESSGLNTFINKYAGQMVNLDQKQVDYGDVLMGFLMLVTGGVFVYLWITGRIVLKVQRHSFVIIAWFGYMYCISGGMYNIIRGTQWASYEDGGKKFSYIHPQFRDQHSSEGFMMGMLQILCGLMMTLLVVRAFESADQTATSTTTTSTTSQTKSSTATTAINKRAWHQNVTSLILDALSPTVCIFIGCAAWMQLNSVYRMKSHG